MVVACFCGAVYEPLYGAPMCPHCGESAPGAEVADEAGDPNGEDPRHRPR